MKTVYRKSLVLLAGVVLVVPFVAVSLLVGAQAAGGGGTDERLVLAALAFGWTIFGGVRGLRGGDAAREFTLRRASVRARETLPTLP